MSFLHNVVFFITYSRSWALSGTFLVQRCPKSPSGIFGGWRWICNYQMKHQLYSCTCHQIFPLCTAWPKKICQSKLDPTWQLWYLHYYSYFCYTWQVESLITTELTKLMMICLGFSWGSVSSTSSKRVLLGQLGHALQDLKKSFQKMLKKFSFTI